MIENKKKPNPIDIHVGSRIRLRRTMLGMSQEKLGESLGITFQQIQKYEKGTNRIGSSRMHQIALILQMPVSFFFEGLPQPGSGSVDQDSLDPLKTMVSTQNGIRLMNAFLAIHDPKLILSLVHIAETLAEAKPQGLTRADTLAITARHARAAHAHPLDDQVES